MQKNKKKFENVDFMLGPDGLGGYKIIEHNRQWPKGDGCCCFDVCEYFISDGDGAPADYDNRFVIIEEKDYKEAMFRFRKIGKELDYFGNEKSYPRERPFQSEDCFFDGSLFAKIEILLPQFKDSIVTGFGYYWYDLDVDTDRQNLSDILDEGDIEDILNNACLISEEDFRIALKMAKDAIHDITDYLGALYASKKNQSTPSPSE